jgi:hypothetical protein
MDTTTLPVWLAINAGLNGQQMANAQRMASMPASGTEIMIPGWVLWVLFFTLVLPLFIVGVISIWSVLYSVVKDLYDEISYKIKYG